MKKIIAAVLIMLVCMFVPQAVYADSEETENDYYDRLIAEINDGLSFDGDDEVSEVLKDNDID